MNVIQWVYKKKTKTTKFLLREMREMSVTDLCWWREERYISTHRTAGPSGLYPIYVDEEKKDI